jgi:hypothetical protein
LRKVRLTSGFSCECQVDVVDKHRAVRVPIVVVVVAVVMVRRNIADDIVLMILFLVGR